MEPGDRSETPEVHADMVLVVTPAAPIEPLHQRAQRLVDDIRPEMDRAKGARWVFGVLEPVRPSDDDPRLTFDFLDEASLQMVEAPLDLVLVVTDTGRVTVRGDVPWAAFTSTSRGTIRDRRIDASGAELMLLVRMPAGWRITCRAARHLRTALNHRPLPTPAPPDTTKGATMSAATIPVLACGAAAAVAACVIQVIVGRAEELLCLSPREDSKIAPWFVDRLGKRVRIAPRKVR
jgi:hypothetical protein